MTWGPLAEPLHHTAARAGDPPWRENAFYSFWDEASGVAGAVYGSTSPNAGGRRARASAAIGGLAAEVVSPLEPMRVTGEGITVDLDGRLRVETPTLQVDLT